MQQSISKIQRDISILKGYAFTISILFIATTFYLVLNKNDRFKEITVERINVIEPNGNIRMVISNKELSPEVLHYGKAYTPPIPGHDRPGIIFYNDEGTENGGLTFMGHTDSNGKYVAIGHFSFDQYNQNQVLYLQYADENGRQTTGLHVDDWQEKPPFWEFREKYKAAQKMPEGPKKDRLLKQLMNPNANQSPFAQRVFVGKDNNKTATVILADRLGNPRLQLLVDSSGTPKINFLDQQGHVVYSLPK
jgi:hypothetical protein